MKRPTARLLRTFVTGLLAALPLAATLLVFGWAASALVQLLGPHSPVGQVLVAIGLGVTGSEIVGYLIGVGLVAVAIFALGLAVEAGLQRGMNSIVEAVVRRIPVVRTVYDLMQKVVDLFARRPPGEADEGLRSMTAVWCHFGGRKLDEPGRAGEGVKALALLPTPQVFVIDGRRCVSVIIPTAPVPMGGGLLYVPEDWVTPADVGIEALTSIYVSMGLTGPQHLPLAGGRVQALAVPGASSASPAPSASKAA